MIIGLLGRSRVGKDTVAMCIVATLGTDNTCITRLSQPLKDATQSLYSFTKEQVEDGKKEEVDPRYGVTPRVCIQGLCDYMMTSHGVDFFSKQLFAKYDSAHFGNKHVIIPDIRYEHDIGEIQKRGGIVIKIERSCAQIPRHSWEDHIDGLKADHYIVNDTDVASLSNKVNQILCRNGLS